VRDLIDVQLGLTVRL